MSHTCLCLPSRSWYSFTDPRRLSRPWCEVALAEIWICNLPIANPALYHTAISASNLPLHRMLVTSDNRKWFKFLSCQQIFLFLCNWLRFWLKFRMELIYKICIRPMRILAGSVTSLPLTHLNFHHWQRATNQIPPTWIPACTNALTLSVTCWQLYSQHITIIILVSSDTRTHKQHSLHHLLARWR